MRTIIPSTPNPPGERQSWTFICLTIATFTVLTPLLSQLQHLSNSNKSSESTLIAGRGEDSDKCVWLGICD
ncbi:hypothetical protein NEA10_08995 [Phormidium yuhuli AB48]|uniref:Uncharacterized protein n=1 Tax=Phormidium yuhuli AB48 TaxID=2940671 RepID=A0ABY5AX05_9CYAN|nr:hypothetical protein [Phormidium yuhuli]USR92831.1 hypothetical protein NEA10_08995 [Phormidium yuhuli AB48]